MTDKVIHLAPPPTFAQETNAQCIKLLKELLKDAEEGKLTEFIIAYQSEGQYHHVWTGCDDMIKMMGMLARMQHLLHRRMDTTS